QLPLASAVAVPSVVEPSFTVIVRLASATSIVPLIDTVVVLGVKSLPLEPLSGQIAVTASVGAVVSIVTDCAAEAPVLPATSVAHAVPLSVPFPCTTFFRAQLPLASAVAVPSVVEPSFTVIVRLASATSIVPLIDTV